MSEPGRPIVALWQDWDEQSIEHLVLREGRDGVIAESSLHGAFAARYRIVCDRTWRVREIQVRVIGGDRTLRLEGDGAGHWRDGSGAALPQLDGAIDVDLTVTPFTNTLPIRRLSLAKGQAAEIVVVYIDPPGGLTVTTEPQRYTCLKPLQRYRFESLDGDFVREIEVDGHGLVVNYPGRFRSVLRTKGRDER